MELCELVFDLVALKNCKTYQNEKQALEINKLEVKKISNWAKDRLKEGLGEELGWAEKENIVELFKADGSVSEVRLELVIKVFNEGKHLFIIIF